jgi:hypothetical protein
MFYREYSFTHDDSKLLVEGVIKMQDGQNVVSTTFVIP